jgi:hypothetical protein
MRTRGDRRHASSGTDGGRAMSGSLLVGSNGITASGAASDRTGATIDRLVWRPAFRGLRHIVVRGACQHAELIGELFVRFAGAGTQAENEEHVLEAVLLLTLLLLMCRTTGMAAVRPTSLSRSPHDADRSLRGRAVASGMAGYYDHDSTATIR